MKPADVVLYITSRIGTVPGRTVLQKLCYFANVKAAAGIPFKAHYYGPYSPDVARATDSLLVFDYVDEKTESGSLSSPWMTRRGTVITDWERRCYNLTATGKNYWDRIPKEQREALGKADELIAKLERATRLDARKLATLAKVHFLMQQNQLAPTDVPGILAAAKAEGWKMTESGVERALKTLSSLPL
ncbi:MAG: hypothetical protein ACHQ2Y_04950 [Candidatus Lutacidiplasmatales archaeon]